MNYNFIIILVAIGVAVISYLLGSISTAVIFTKLITKTDVRDYGSGNAGLTNVLRTAGKLPGILTLIGDFGKAVAAVAISRYGAYALLELLTHGEISGQLDPLFLAYLSGLFCVIGHIYPVYFSFRGGKGVLTSAGVVLLIDWKVFLIVIGVFIIFMLLTKIVSASSIAAAVAFPIATFLLNIGKSATYSFSLFGIPQSVTLTLFALLFAVVVIVKHKDNIKRIIKGEEKKFAFKK